MSTVSQNPEPEHEPSRREELRDNLAALLEMTLSPRDASDAVDTLDELVAAVLDEAAGDFEARVPPVTAGPLTDRDRGLRYAAAELRRMATEARAAQTGGAS